MLASEQTDPGAHGEVHRALERLEAIVDSAELSRQAPAELRTACGFARVMISRVEGTRWFPDTMGVADGADPGAAEFPRFAGVENQIPLASGLAETRMLRTREAVMVQDPRSDPRAYQPLVRVTRSLGYVVAPIVAADRVIGFLHADRSGQPVRLTSADLDSVALFAVEFGVLFETAVLRERIAHAQTDIGAAFRAAAAGLDSLAKRSVALDTADSEPVRISATTGRPAPRRDALLTAREREVLTLIAKGAGNRAIAVELVISVDTVKTHVRGILRKLRASSRAEALARYLRLRDESSGS
jgi:DNA-binding CsgD family transcriptional regulator